MIIPYNLTINLDKPSVTNHVVIRQGEANGRRLFLHIISNNKVMDVKKIFHVSVKAAKPDETIIHDQAKIEDGKIYYDLIEQIATTTGEVEMEVELIGANDTYLSSFPVYITVKRNVYDVDALVSQDELRGIRAYVSAAYNVLQETKAVDEKFGAVYGTAKEVTEKLSATMEEYLEFMDDLEKKLEEGYFNGERGPAGENGSDGIIVEGAGIMGFQIKDGNLLCHYFESEPPMMMDDDGNLIYVVEEA